MMKRLQSCFTHDNKEKAPVCATPNSTFLILRETSVRLVKQGLEKEVDFPATEAPVFIEMWC